MTSPMAFEAVPAPALGDAADGVKAFNGIATADENNFNKVNTWAAHANQSLTARASVNGAALFTPAAGWTSTAGQVTNTYGRRWMGVTYLRIDFTLTGANIASGSRCNITDTLVGNIAAGWQPFVNDLVVLGSLYNCTPAVFTLKTDGRVYVCGFSYPEQTWVTSYYGIIQAAFTDSAPA